MAGSFSEAPAAMPAPEALLIVVAADARDRLAIQRAFRNTAICFASSVEEAEAMALATNADGFYVY